jgi:hypothetical protein
MASDVDLEGLCPAESDFAGTLEDRRRVHLGERHGIMGEGGRLGGKYE